MTGPSKPHLHLPGTMIPTNVSHIYLVDMPHNKVPNPPKGLVRERSPSPHSCTSYRIGHFDSIQSPLSFTIQCLQPSHLPLPLTNNPPGKMSHFEPNAILRGAQLTVVGALRALKNPGLFTSEHYKQAALAVLAGIVIRLLVAIPVCL